MDMDWQLLSRPGFGAHDFYGTIVLSERGARAEGVLRSFSDRPGVLILAEMLQASERYEDARALAEVVFGSQTLPPPIVGDLADTILDKNPARDDFEPIAVDVTVRKAMMTLLEDRMGTVAHIGDALPLVVGGTIYGWVHGEYSRGRLDPLARAFARSDALLLRWIQALKEVGVWAGDASATAAKVERQFHDTLAEYERLEDPRFSIQEIMEKARVTPDEFDSIAMLFILSHDTLSAFGLPPHGKQDIMRAVAEVVGVPGQKAMDLINLLEGAKVGDWLMRLKAELEIIPAVGTAGVWPVMVLGDRLSAEFREGWFALLEKWLEAVRELSAIFLTDEAKAVLAAGWDDMIKATWQRFSL